MVDKYIPTHFYQLIGQDYTNKNVLKYVTKWKECILSKKGFEDMKPLVFNGPAGTGKTTLAKLISEVLGFDLLVVNASAERSGVELYKKIDNFLNRG